MNGSFLPIPTITERSSKGERSYDLYSKMLKERIVFITGEIDDCMSNLIVAQLLFLEGEDPDEDISIYINSPGGYISSGMSIYDTMQFIRPSVSTLCIGRAASMGAFLLAAGTKGKRYALPNSRIMIHQPLGGAQGQASDIKIQAKEILILREQLNQLLAVHTNQNVGKVSSDTERDYFMSSYEAKAYGLIDKVLTSNESS